MVRWGWIHCPKFSTPTSALRLTHLAQVASAMARVIQDAGDQLLTKLEQLLRLGLGRSSECDNFQTHSCWVTFLSCGPKKLWPKRISATIHNTCAQNTTYSRRLQQRGEKMCCSFTHQMVFGSGCGCCCYSGGRLVQRFGKHSDSLPS